MTATSVTQVLGLYERLGDELYDEKVSQSSHALQCAALARSEGADDFLVAAALLHDIGHLLDIETHGPVPPKSGVNFSHEKSGAQYLSSIFPPAVTDPIALHVLAKRYLCAIDARYESSLSKGSRQSLIGQGGAFDPQECAEFSQQPEAINAIDLRCWDDSGKVSGLIVPPLEDYRSLLDDLVVI